MTRGHQYKVASDMLKESFMGLKLPSLHLTGTDSQVEGNSHGVYVRCTLIQHIILSLNVRTLIFSLREGTTWSRKKNHFQLRVQGWNLILNFKRLQTSDFLNLSYMLTGSFKNMYKWSWCSLILLLRFQFLHEVVNFFRSCHKIYPDTSLLNCSLINAGHCRARMTNFFQRMRYFTITGCWVWSVRYSHLY